MKRSTGASRIASSRICVPSTFVRTNSEPPSRIDFSTCDSAAALTITSTLLDDVAHELGVADVAVHERQPLVRHHVGEVLDVARVRERVERDDVVRRLRQQVADEVRRDEAGAAGDENSFAQSSSAIVYRGLPSTCRWILPRYSPTSARMNPWMPRTKTISVPPKSGPGKFDSVIQKTTP